LFQLLIQFLNFIRLLGLGEYGPQAKGG